jgi:hypothetical protein
MSAPERLERLRRRRSWITASIMRLEDAGKRHLADRRMAAYARVTRAIYALLSANPGLSGTERAA